LILEFPSNGDGVDTISVCDHLHPNCCTSLIFNTPDCQCTIFCTTVETLGCSSDSTFAVSIEFFSQNLPVNFVDAFIDGVYFGTYNISQIPFIIPDVPEGNGFA